MRGMSRTAAKPLTLLVPVIAVAALALTACRPANAQWVQGTGDDFNGSSFDTNYWSFNVTSSSGTVNTQSSANYAFGTYADNAGTGSVKGVEVNDNSTRLGSTTGLQNIASVLVSSTAPLPVFSTTIGWYIDARVATNFEQTGTGTGYTYNFAGIFIAGLPGTSGANMSNNNFQLGWKHNVYMSGNNNRESSELYYNNGTFVDDAVSPNVFFNTTTGDYGDIRIQQNLSSGVQTGFTVSMQTPVYNSNALQSVTVNSASTGNALAVYNYLNSIQGKEIGILSENANSAGTVQANATFDYFHTNLTAVASTAPEPSSVALAALPLLAGGAGLLRRRKLRMQA